MQINMEKAVGLKRRKWLILFGAGGMPNGEVVFELEIGVVNLDRVPLCIGTSMDL